ncbi:MAG: sensor histidine kinase [Nitrospirota bacterium]
MDLYTTRRTRTSEMVSSFPAEGANSAGTQQQPVRRDPRFNHQDLRELLSLTRSLRETADQVGRDSLFGPSERVDQGLSLLITGATRLSDLAAGIRELPSGVACPGGVFRERFDVAGLLQVLMISTRAMVGSRPVKVELVSSERPLTLCSDSGRVLQIVSNLLENAARNTDRGRITLILGRQQDSLTLMVTDTGKGMREADLKSIIARMNGSAGRRPSGRAAVGTGLLRTRALVKLLGGDISLMSRWNEGTIVEVRLPLDAGRGDQACGTGAGAGCRV